MNERDCQQQVEKIGGELRQHRKKQRLPLRVVAKKLKLSIATVSRIETAFLAMTINQFLQYANILKVDPAKIISTALSEANTTA